MIMKCRITLRAWSVYLNFVNFKCEFLSFLFLKTSWFLIYLIYDTFLVKNWKKLMKAWHNLQLNPTSIYSNSLYSLSTRCWNIFERTVTRRTKVKIYTHWMIKSCSSMTSKAKLKTPIKFMITRRKNIISGYLWILYRLNLISLDGRKRLKKIFGIYCDFSRKIFIGCSWSKFF
jgi:hypothetical protein